MPPLSAAMYRPASLCTTASPDGPVRGRQQHHQQPKRVRPSLPRSVRFAPLPPPLPHSAHPPRPSSPPPLGIGHSQRGGGQQEQQQKQPDSNAQRSGPDERDGGQERGNLWWTKDEIEGFKTVARTTSVHRRSSLTVRAGALRTADGAAGGGAAARPGQGSGQPRAQPPQRQRTEPRRTEPQQTETQRAETQRTETQRTETQRTETQRTETQRTETQRTETQRTETQRTETQRTETQRGGQDADDDDDSDSDSDRDYDSDDAPRRDGSDDDDDDETNERSCPRGLEHRVSHERQRRKLLVLRSVLEYQRRLRHGLPTSRRERADPIAAAEAAAMSPPDRLARYAARCSRWAGDVALATGQSDFLEVYPRMASSVYHANPCVPFLEMSSPPPPPPPSGSPRGGSSASATPPAPPSRKRSASGESTSADSTGSSDSAGSDAPGDGDRNVRRRTDGGGGERLGPDPELRDFLRSVFTGGQ